MIETLADGLEARARREPERSEGSPFLRLVIWIAPHRLVERLREGDNLGGALVLSLRELTRQRSPKRCAAKNMLGILAVQVPDEVQRRDQLAAGALPCCNRLRPDDVCESYVESPIARCNHRCDGCPRWAGGCASRRCRRAATSHRTQRLESAGASLCRGCDRRGVSRSCGDDRSDAWVRYVALRVRT